MLRTIIKCIQVEVGLYSRLHCTYYIADKGPGNAVRAMLHIIALTSVQRVNQHPLTLMSSIALAVWYLLESLARNLLPLGLARPLPPEGRPEPGLGVTVTS